MTPTAEIVHLQVDGRWRFAVVAYRYPELQVPDPITGRTMGVWSRDYDSRIELLLTRKDSWLLHSYTFRGINDIVNHRYTHVSPAVAANFLRASQHQLPGELHMIPAPSPRPLASEIWQPTMETAPLATTTAMASTTKAATVSTTRTKS
jgi:hypothetical protein